MSGIYEEKILFKLANNFAADIYFFIWRCCEEKDQLRFKFTIPQYFDSQFQMRTVLYLSRLELIKPIKWDKPHVGIEKLIASDIKISKKGNKIFQNWMEIGLVRLILSLSHDIRQDEVKFNNYFNQNFKFSENLEEERINRPSVEIIDYDFMSLKGPAEHKIDFCIEFKQKIDLDSIKKELLSITVLISCGFCKEHFIFAIKSQTYYRYLHTKRIFKKGCPNCRYPNYRTKFLLNFSQNEFDFERYLTDRDKERLYNQKRKLKNKIFRRFRIFISNNVLNHSKKRSILRKFEEELDDKWDKLMVHSILFNEFQDTLLEFYNKKKKEIKSLL